MLEELIINIDYPCNRKKFMENYFEKLPNDIQGKIINMVCGLIREFCDNYNVNKSDIISSPFIKLNKLFVNIFHNHYLYYNHLPDGKYSQVGDIIVNKREFIKSNHTIEKINIYMVAGFKSFACNNLYDYFFPIKQSLDTFRNIKPSTYNVCLGLYKINNYLLNKPNKDDIKIYNILYTGNLEENNIKNEYSLHKENEFIVISPQSLFKKNRWLDYI